MTDRLTRLIRRLALVAGFLAFDAQCAELQLPDSVQVHGFVSQAAIQTSDNNFFGETEDDVSLDFQELGVNGSWRVRPNLQLSLQVLSRDAGKGDDGDLRVDYGFVDYSFISNADDLWGLRVGRVINPLGLYNDTRDVAFTRSSILLPQSIYFDRTRNLALSSDGAQFYGERRSRFGDFIFQFNAGRPRLDDPDIEQSFLGSNFPGKLDDELSFLGRVLYEKMGGRIRAALSGGRVNVDYDSGLADPLRSGSIVFAPLILSGQYNAERWSVTAEYARRRFEVDDVFTDLGSPEIKRTGESIYVQGTYRFSPRWEGLVRYDVLYNNRDDRDGREFETTTGRPAHTQFAKDFTIGVRWDITKSVMFRTEFHRVNGTAWLPFADNPDVGAVDRRWNLFAILGSYRF